MYPRNYYIPNINMFENSFLPFYPGRFNSRNVGLLEKITGGIKSINLNKALVGANKTLNFINQAIPLIREARPLVNNMKSMIKLAKVFSTETLKNDKNISNMTVSKKSNEQVSTNKTNNNIISNSDCYKDSNYPTFFI